MMQLLLKTAWQFLKIIKQLPCDSAIPLVDTDPRQNKIYIHTKFVHIMFTAASVFMIAEKGKQPKCLSVDEEIKYVYR